MLKLYRDLIGYEQTGITEFGLYGHDTAAKFDSIVKSQPKDWYYRTHKVTYNRNSTGHRSCEVSELGNFILFAGCSVTVGSAVELEKTFPYIVAKANGLDYYNLAVEGAGYDLITYNVSAWLASKPKPTAIVIRWPQKERTFRIEGTKVIPIGPWSESHGIDSKYWDEFTAAIQTDYFEHYSEVLRHSVKALAASHNIPLIELFDTDPIDVGRDLKHPGILSHMLMAETILKSCII